MNIAVIGAGGRTGRVFVQKALDSGHYVSAGVHSHNPFQKHPNLRVINCDATKLADISALAQGCEVAIITIGHTKRSTDDVQERTVQNLLKTDVVKIVCLTGTGVRLTDDKITIVDRFLNFGVKLVDPKRINDGQKHIELLQESNKDWAVLRVLKLQNTESKGFTLNEHGPARTIVSRDDAAEALLELAVSKEWNETMPILG